MLDGRDHEFRLGALARRRMDGDAVVYGVDRGGGRLMPRRGDDLRRGGDDGSARAIVLAQADELGLGMVLLEAAEASGVGGGEAVDRLVRVADDTDAGARRGEQREQPVLLVVDVLELVDGDRAE